MREWGLLMGIKSFLFFVLFNLFFLAPAFGQFPDIDKKPEAKEKRVRWSAKDSTMAAGLASNSQLLYTSQTALTGLFSVGEKSSAQAFLIVSGSDPMTYGIGGLYKYTVSGTKRLGFHVGGGLGLGDYAEDRSFFRISGVAGFHFRVRKRILFHVDGGLTLSRDDALVDGGDDSNQTTITGQSSIFGLSIMYMF